MVCIGAAATPLGSWSNGNNHLFLMEHADLSAAGTIGEWSEVYPSQILHSVYGQGGAFSTLALAPSGLWATITSGTWSDTVQAVGYVGERRFVRIRISALSVPSTMSMAGIAMLGYPADWPVMTPVRL
jgi:hypothetical protein